MKRDDPGTVAEVQGCFARYENALAKQDLATMAACFDDAASLVRFGIADQQSGPEELARWRAGQPPLPVGRRLFNTAISTYGADVAVVTTNFSYPTSSLVGRQSQTWVRDGGRWRIVHAHVSQVPGPAPTPVPRSP